MARAAKTIAEKMIKVDHAGENGAVNIYRGQKLMTHIRGRSLLKQLNEYQQHEEEHRQIFSDHLAYMGVRRCVSYHLCGVGGFCLGIVTGLIGSTAIFATTYAVEDVVLEHLTHQLKYLKDHDLKAHDCVFKIIRDEQKHRDRAMMSFDPNSLLSKSIVKLVRFSTEAVIRFGMR